MKDDEQHLFDLAMFESGVGVNYEAHLRLQPVFEAIIAAMPGLAANVLAGKAPKVKLQCEKHHPLGTLALVVDYYGWRLMMPDAADHAVMPASIGHGMGSTPLDAPRGRFDALRSKIMCRTCDARIARHVVDGRKLHWRTYSAEPLLKAYVSMVAVGRDRLTLPEVDIIATQSLKQIMHRITAM